MAANTSSYIDIEKLVAPDFSAHAHANTLVLSTNNASDPAIDLTTPLSKALFDLQEIDSNIHSLTSRSALEILHHTSTQNAAAARIITKIEEERSRLNLSYARLEKEVIGQYTKAANAKLHAERSHQVLELGRGVQRVLVLARQFEVLCADSGLISNQSSAVAATTKSAISREDHRSIVRAAYLVLGFRDLMNSKDSANLARINAVRTIRGRVFEDGEAKILDYARRIVREFSINSINATAGFKEAEDAKARFASVTHILYLLSPAPQMNGQRQKKEEFEAEYLILALQEYLSTAIKSSSASIARALGQLPTLDRALPDVSARCQSVAALETLLRGINPPKHPLLLQAPEQIQRDDTLDSADDYELLDDETDGEGEEEVKQNFLDLVLDSLDTSSLPSYFWRSLASQLSTRVQEILNRGGVVARTLRSNRDEVRNQIRECVLRGSKMPSSLVTAASGQSGREQIVGNWEREAAVMVGSIVGPLGR